MVSSEGDMRSIGLTSELLWLLKCGRNVQGEVRARARQSTAVMTDLYQNLQTIV